MRFPAALLIVAAAVYDVHALPTQSANAHRETLPEAAANAKRLLHEVNTGTMGSVFPADSDHAGRPFALMEYHAPCFASPSLTMLLLPISLSTHNILSTPSRSATYTVQTPSEGVYSPMSRGRVALIGNVTVLPSAEMSRSEAARLEQCYTRYHPDARAWLPDRPESPHASVWARFEPQDIYYVGGFGDTHYIGHIPVDLYAAAGEDVSIALASGDLLLQQ